MTKRKINIICGPTASGKSNYALNLAKECDGIIINADSMQVYKGLEIITAQPNKDDRKRVPHYLYGYIDLASAYSVGIWLQEVVTTINDILKSGKTPIVVGGTGMYINALVNGLATIPSISEDVKIYVRSISASSPTKELHQKLMEIDPVLASRLKNSDTQRITRGLEVYYETGRALSDWQKQNNAIYMRDKFSITLITPERNILYDRINRRFLEMLDHGLIEEIRNVIPMSGFDITNQNTIKLPKAIGLEQMLHHILGKITLDEAICKSQQLTRNYAKRQTTWFKNQLSYDNIITY